MQIVQELCKRPGLNKTGFDMPTIYIPNPNKVLVNQISIKMILIITFCSKCLNCGFMRLQTVRCANQIEEVCKDIEKTINQTIQNTLNTLVCFCIVILFLLFLMSIFVLSHNRKKIARKLPILSTNKLKMTTKLRLTISVLQEKVI